MYSVCWLSSRDWQVADGCDAFEGLAVYLNSKEKPDCSTPISLSLLALPLVILQFPILQSILHSNQFLDSVPWGSAALLSAFFIVTAWHACIICRAASPTCIVSQRCRALMSVAVPQRPHLQFVEEVTSHISACLHSDSTALFAF
jgi:hypothetical protein